MPKKVEVTVNFIVRAIRPFVHPKTGKSYLPGEYVPGLTDAQMKKGIDAHELAIKVIDDGDD